MLPTPRDSTVTLSPLPLTLEGPVTIERASTTYIQMIHAAPCRLPRHVKKKKG